MKFSEIKMGGQKNLTSVYEGVNYLYIKDGIITSKDAEFGKEIIGTIYYITKFLKKVKKEEDIGYLELWKSSEVNFYGNNETVTFFNKGKRIENKTGVFSIFKSDEHVKSYCNIYFIDDKGRKFRITTTGFTNYFKADGSDEGNPNSIYNYVSDDIDFNKKHEYQTKFSVKESEYKDSKSFYLGFDKSSITPQVIEQKVADCFDSMQKKIENEQNRNNPSVPQTGEEVRAEVFKNAINSKDIPF